MEFSRYQHVMNVLVIIVITALILIVAKSVLIPLIFGLFISLLFEPLCKRLERIGVRRIWSTIWAFLVVALFVSGLMYFFSAQITSVLDNIFQSGNDIINRVLSRIEENTNISEASVRQWIDNNFERLMNGQLAYAFGSIANSIGLIFSAGIAFVYAFLFLIYRSSIKNFLLSQFPEEKQSTVVEVLAKIVKVVQQYLLGLGIMVSILIVMNSLGLMLVGIENAILWGITAGLLAVIPYVGNLVGASFPVLQTLVSDGPLWQTFAVIAVFIVVQQIEGNFITPKIIGSKVNINPFTAILSLIIGAAFWGIPGMIIAIPVCAIIKIIFDHTEHLKKVGLLMGDNLQANSSKFFE